jgi:hypothetical protein
LLRPVSHTARAEARAIIADIGGAARADARVSPGPGIKVACLCGADYLEFGNIPKHVDEALADGV